MAGKGRKTAGTKAVPPQLRRTQTAIKHVFFYSKFMEINRLYTQHIKSTHQIKTPKINWLKSKWIEKNRLKINMLNRRWLGFKLWFFNGFKTYQNLLLMIQPGDEEGCGYLCLDNEEYIICLSAEHMIFLWIMKQFCGPVYIYVKKK